MYRDILLHHADMCFATWFTWFWHKANCSFYTFVYLKNTAPLPRELQQIFPNLAIKTRMLRADTLAQALCATEKDEGQEIFVYTEHMDIVLKEARGCKAFCEIPKLDVHPIEAGFAEKYGDAELMQQLDAAKDAAEYSQLLHFFAEENDLCTAWLDYLESGQASLFAEWIDQHDDFAISADAQRDPHSSI